jgi:hypothetical protein
LERSEPASGGIVALLVGIVALCWGGGYGGVVVLECCRSIGVLYWLGVYGMGQEGLVNLGSGEDGVRTMEEELKREALDISMQQQEQLFARLQPASELEEHLARQIAVCNAQLEQIENRLTKAWSQLNKVYEELDQQPLP